MASFYCLNNREDVDYDHHSGGIDYYVDRDGFTPCLGDVRAPLEVWYKGTFFNKKYIEKLIDEEMFGSDNPDWLLF